MTETAIDISGYAYEDEDLNPYDPHAFDHGHINLSSMATLRQLLREAGFHAITFHRVGYAPALAKSMLAIATRL